MALINWIDLAFTVHRLEEEGFPFPSHIYREDDRLCARWTFRRKKRNARKKLTLALNPDHTWSFLVEPASVFRVNWLKELRVKTRDEWWLLEGPASGHKAIGAFGFLGVPS